ncbi:hypothetical protein IWZ03DRAFT_355755 [Phyllosticta citriasiana]|uniref:Uncharacterized protein n=1 Tax=Phyllosticta citriasiana TaxID=595635 RepID=A0ABR1KYC9_9PEZI
MNAPYDSNQLAAALSSISLSYEAQIFREEYQIAKDLLQKADIFEKAEMSRLRDMIQKLTSENTALSSAQQNGAAIIPAVAGILETSPIKSLPLPCASFYDELAPKLAEFIENNEEYFGQASEFREIWRDFGRAQSTEDCMYRFGDQIRDLAVKNYELRVFWVHRAAGDEKNRLETIHGEAAHPRAFVRPVPSTVSSDEMAPMRNSLAGLEELEKLSGGRDFVLEETTPIPDIEGAVYHPFSSAYVPSFLGMGIPHTGPTIQIADDGVSYDGTHDAWKTPGGSRVWVSKRIPWGNWLLR